MFFYFSIMQAIYPGFFDPVTRGHLDVIRRASKLFVEGLKIVVSQNPNKECLFATDERVDFIKKSITDLDNVEVLFYEGLIVEYLRKNEQHVIVRGLRAVSDFEYELQIASTNQKLYHKTETVFFPAREHYTYLSSSLVKELASFKAPIHDFVPPVVESALKKKFLQS